MFWLYRQIGNTFGYIISEADGMADAGLLSALSLGFPL